MDLDRVINLSNTHTFFLITTKDMISFPTAVPITTKQTVFTKALCYAEQRPIFGLSILWAIRSSIKG